MNVAVVGATGVVGRMMTKLLAHRGFPITNFYPVASPRSLGQSVEYNGKQFPVMTHDQALEHPIDVALFSAGGSTSLEWAPKYAAKGIKVIDNSSAWRMDPTKKLVVPEINGSLLSPDDLIIANPNCSTIQLVMALAPLHEAFGIKRVVISTYQSVTGTGKAAVEQMENERAGKTGKMVYPYAIDGNCIPHCDVFMDNDYTKEEMKLTNETKKIIGDDSIRAVATAVRVPVTGGHSESVNVEFIKPAGTSEIRQILHQTSGVTLQDNPDTNTYPMPLYAREKDDVFVGRIREDFTQDNTFNMWIVSDNLRKGAATNAIQIAESMMQRGLLPNK